jgi:hypothetical protein
VLLLLLLLLLLRRRRRRRGQRHAVAGNDTPVLQLLHELHCAGKVLLRMARLFRPAGDTSLMEPCVAVDSLVCPNPNTRTQQQPAAPDVCKGCHALLCQALRLEGLLRDRKLLLHALPLQQ